MDTIKNSYWIIEYLSGESRCESLYIIMSPVSAWNVYFIKNEEDVTIFKKNYKDFVDGGEIKVEKWEIESDVKNNRKVRKLNYKTILLSLCLR